MLHSRSTERSVEFDVARGHRVSGPFPRKPNSLRFERFSQAGRLEQLLDCLSERSRIFRRDQESRSPIRERLWYSVYIGANARDAAFMRFKKRKPKRLFSGREGEYRIFG